MCKTGKNYRIILSTLISPAFLLFYSDGFSQNHADNDSIVKIRSGPIFEPLESGSFFLNIPFNDPSHLRQPSSISLDKNIFFYNSLEVRASKRPLTKKIYEFIIVNTDTINSKQITGPAMQAILSIQEKESGILQLNV